MKAVLAIVAVILVILGFLFTGGDKPQVEDTLVPKIEMKCDGKSCLE